MDKSADAKAANRRQSMRRKPRGTVHVECRKGSTGLGANLTTAVLDVSDTGVRLVVSQSLDAKVEVEIMISSYGMKETIKRLGYVRWVRKLENGPYCIGVEFQKRLVYRDWQTISSPS